MRVIRAGNWKYMIIFGYKLRNLCRKITKPKSKAIAEYNKKQSFTIKSISKERKIIYFPISNIM